MNFVLDSSVTLAWIFADEATPETDALRRRLGEGAKALVPALWWWEIANVVRHAERSDRIGESGVSHQLSVLRQLPIVVDELATSMAWDSTLLLARRHNLTSYDAAYLEIALRSGLPLASLDKALRKAAGLEKVMRLPKSK